MSIPISSICPPRCFSSLGMADLLIWRNPSREEKKWLRKPPVQQISPSVFKKSVTEVALVGLAATSFLESIGYVASTALSLLVKPVSNKPFEKSVKLLESSSFTVFWAIVDLYLNLKRPNLITQESIARLGHDWEYEERAAWAKFRREEDITFINEYFPGIHLNRDQAFFMTQPHGIHIPPIPNTN